ncbi:MAG: enoyl-CoA hydratase/isomerase family protein [Pyrinomonadaceae bacterium]
MSNELEIEYQGQAMIVRFTRPEIRNPLSVAVLDTLFSIVDDLGNRPEIEKVILTGSSDVFASGANLNEIAEITTEAARDFARKGQRIMTVVSNLEQTTIAAINGFCFGGALDLALACDLRIAAPTATFAHPGAGLGIITGWGGTQRLPRLIGTANALEMFFTASSVDAETALRIGLIDSVSDNPFEDAIKWSQSDAA